MAAHEKVEHDYHLVDPSPWPFFMSLSVMAMLTGFALYMHDRFHGEYIAIAGLLGVLTIMYTWWRDVVREAVAGYHKKIVQSGLRLGMGLFIASEVMFFSAFFWGFFNASVMPVVPFDVMDNVWGMAEGVWPPEGIETFDPWHLPFMNTLILLLSGTSVTWAHHALLHNDRAGFIKGLSITVALGVFFSMVQAYEYGHAAFGFTDGIYASTFYMATGFHGLHVLIGTIFLAVCLIRGLRGQMDSENHIGFEFAAWYWHFVDVVWLFLFVFIYVWGA